MAMKVKSTLGVVAEIGRLRTLKCAGLRARYLELYGGQEPKSNNSPYLLKKIAARLQEQPGLEKSGEVVAATPSNRDPRLPQVGAILTKTFKGRELKVVVAADGFEFEGERFRSLSAIARKVAGGTSWNGFGFFGLLEKEGA